MFGHFLDVLVGLRVSEHRAEGPFNRVRPRPLIPANEKQEENRGGGRTEEGGESVELHRSGYLRAFRESDGFNL